jgi:hypothetical protein
MHRTPTMSLLGRRRPRSGRSLRTVVGALAALAVLAAPLVAQSQASAALNGTATIADTNRPRSNTFATELDDTFSSTTRVLMRTLDAGTTTWREWGLELGQGPLDLSAGDSYDASDTASRELLVEGLGTRFNGLFGYDYSRPASNGRLIRNDKRADVPAAFASTDGTFQQFSTRESGGLLVELTFLEFTEANGILARSAIANAEFRLEILTAVKPEGNFRDVDYRLPTLNELSAEPIASQTIPGDPDQATKDMLYPRPTGAELFHCDPIANSTTGAAPSCTAVVASAGGAFDPVVDDAAVATATGVTNDTQVGIAQAYGRANSDGKVWLWLTGPSDLDYMIRIYDRRTDDATTDGFADLVAATTLDVNGAVVTAAPIADARVLRVISERSGYAFEGENPSPSVVFADSKRQTNFFAKRRDVGTDLLNYRGALPVAPIDVYAKVGGGTTTSTTNCVRVNDVCQRPDPAIVPVPFNGDWPTVGGTGYVADADDAYFPYGDHAAVGLYSFVPNCDALDLARSTVTVDEPFVAYQRNDGSGGADGAAPTTTVRARLFNSCGQPYRGPSRSIDLTVPLPGGGTEKRTVTTNSSGVATTVITAPLDTNSNDGVETNYSDNIGADFGLDGTVVATTTVNFYGPNTPSVANSTLSMLVSSAVADGSDVTTAVVQLRNVNDAAVGAGTRVCLSFAFEPAPGVAENAWTAPVPPGDLDYWETDATGRVEVDMPSPTTGTVTVTAAAAPCGSAGVVAAGAAIGDPNGVTGSYTAGDADAGASDIEIADERIDPDGTSTTTVTVTVRDENGNPVGAGQPVCLETVDNADGTDSTGTLSSGPWTTDANGQITATVTSPTEAGQATIYGWLGTCGSKGAGIGPVEVTFANAPPPRPADPGGPLVCSPDTVGPGATVTCSFGGGNPDFDYLWQASFLANVFATAGMTTVADGSGGFSFVVPSEAACQSILVELVEWDISTLVTVMCIPTTVPAGSGPAVSPLLPIAAWLLIAGGLVFGLQGRRRGWEPAR